MNAEATAYAVSRSIQGVPGCKIAKEIGVHESTISRTLNQPEIRSIIEQAAKDIIIRSLPAACKTIDRLAKIGNESQDKDMLKLSLDASKHVTSMSGLSGNAPSTIINAMIQINSAPEESKEVQDIRAFLKAKLINATEVLQSETIDVPVRDNAIDVAPPHTVTDCAEIAQLEAKQEACQIVEVEAPPRRQSSRGPGARAKW